MLFVWIMLLFFFFFLSLICANAFHFHALSLFISFFLFASCTVLLICLFFLIICSHHCSFFFIYFLWKGYELSGEIALKNNHYYYYYYYFNKRWNKNLAGHQTRLSKKMTSAQHAQHMSSDVTVLHSLLHEMNVKKTLKLNFFYTKVYVHT